MTDFHRNRLQLSIVKQGLASAVVRWWSSRIRRGYPRIRMRGTSVRNRRPIVIRRQSRRGRMVLDSRCNSWDSTIADGWRWGRGTSIRQTAIANGGFVWTLALVTARDGLSAVVRFVMSLLWRRPSHISHPSVTESAVVGAPVPVPVSAISIVTISIAVVIPVIPWRNTIIEATVRATIDDRARTRGGRTTIYIPMSIV